MRFDEPVEPSGYAWWYVDAISDDGAHALTCIAFIGSVFSPYYAWANAKAPAAAENFCAVNVALYGRKKAWAMTERGRGALMRCAGALRVGPSTLAWNGGELTAAIDEITVPLPARLRGQFTLRAGALQPTTFPLDAAGRHRWRPIAPAARIEVRFTHPQLAWSGQAYFDHNAGDAPLAQDFRSWNWSRSAKAGAGTEATRILYDVTRRDGSTHGLALKIEPSGAAEAFEPPALRALKPGLWGVRRATRADEDFTPVIKQTLEDAPFYTRSIIQSRLGGTESEAIHESLDLNRFSTRWVKCLLPFRMPRWGR